MLCVLVAILTTSITRRLLSMGLFLLPLKHVLIVPIWSGPYSIIAGDQEAGALCCASTGDRNPEKVKYGGFAAMHPCNWCTACDPLQHVK